MYSLIKFFLFLLPPEKAHDIALNLMQSALKWPIIGTLLRRSFKIENPIPVTVAGITFPNILGLAAGFDKDAKRLHLLKEFGFGFVEVGTVTPKAQKGNPKPRLFRIPDNLALINRMGFNNEGIDKMVERLKNRPDGLIVGGNIGKNKSTPNDKAIIDYVYCFEKLYDYVDYIVVNISSPNTPGLRDLQEESFIVGLFSELQKIRTERKVHKPIFLKLSPDFQFSAIKDLVRIITKAKVDGIVATNTTISREKLTISEKEIEKIGPGGLSGQPIFESSNAILATLSIELGGQIPIIGVGGIFNGIDATEKLVRGANLIQIYTGFVYEGPWIVKNILKDINYNS
jgi:dihydroorotate dehydrogenase